MADTHHQEIHRTQLTRQALSRLLRIDLRGQRALSLYLSFDPAQVPNLRERHMEVGSLLDEAERRHEHDGGSHEQRMALRADIERVRALFADEQELAPEPGRGLAVFCSVPAGVFEVVSLPEQVQAQVVVDRELLLEPLLEQVPSTHWCVALVSRRETRLFIGDRDALVEAAHLRDDVHRHVKVGGRSQPRYQKGVEEEVDEHIRGTCALLFERLQQRPFERLLIGGPAELHGDIERALHTDLAKRLAGCFEIDVERANAAEVHQRAMPLLQADERAREREVLARVREGLAPGGHAAVGLDEVLELLRERRVQTLVLPHDFATPGFACPSCGRLSTVDEPCPLDGAQPEPREDIVESAVAVALAQDAEVVLVRHELDELARLAGGVAAIVRF